jgi:hypothetical protein
LQASCTQGSDNICEKTLKNCSQRLLIIGVGGSMVVVTAHGFVEDADGEHGFAVVVEDEEVPGARGRTSSNRW